MRRPPISPKARALRFLSQREHSRLELQRKMKPHVESEAELAALLDWLQTSRFLSDDRYAEALAHRQSGKFGTRRIIGELRQNGIADTIIASLKDGLAASEEASAYAIWERKFGTLPVTPQERARQMRFLMQRGFSGDAIRSVMKHAKVCSESGDEDELWIDEQSL